MGCTPSKSVRVIRGDCLLRMQGFLTLQIKKIMFTSRTPRVYVGTYKKYNNLSTEGDYLDLTDYSDREEFYKACRELHKDETDPEFHFQDWEDLPKFMITESSLDEGVFEYLEVMEAMEDSRANAFDIFVISVHGSWQGLTKMMKYFENSYQGYYGKGTENAEIRYTEQFVDDMGYLKNVPDVVQRYFDFEAYAKELFMADLYEDEGHVLSKNY
jgi:antirestriction protein